MKSYEMETSQRIQDALQIVDASKIVEIGSGILGRTAEVFQNCFGDRPAIIIADMNTYPAAGKRVETVIKNAGLPLLETFIFREADLYAEMQHVDHLVELLSKVDAIAIAVGSGTINDLVKLSSYRCGRQYLAVVTAGSVDGYSAYGASISENSFKQTFYCPAPQAVIVDIDVIAAAPRIMNAWGYADLAAKIPAGADWLIADALEIEPIDEIAWNFVQRPLRKLIADPTGIRNGDQQALCFLIEGLLMSGLAMQQAKSSRPASGAEHQFSHLWDNQHHVHNGKAPSHGFKVAVGSLASIALYESLFEILGDSPSAKLRDVTGYWVDFADIEREIKQVFPNTKESVQIIEQSREKYVAHRELAKRVAQAVSIWPDLKKKLQKQLLDFKEFRDMLRQVAAPQSPLDIGIELERLKSSYRSAWLIRQRYTILDFTQQLGIFNQCIRHIFDSGRYWKSSSE